MTDKTITTRHSIRRAKDRCNLKNSRTAEKHIALALQRGKRAEDFTSWEHDFLANKAHDDCTAIAYNNFCYIVNSAGACVTLLPLPSWFGKKKHFDGKTHIRNFKQYSRYNASFREQMCEAYS